MPNIKSAKKRARLTARQREENKTKRSNLRTAIKKVTSEIGNDAGNSRVLLADAAKKLDKAAASGLIHKNKAARTKSRLARKINAMAKAEAE